MNFRIILFSVYVVFVTTSCSATALVNFISPDEHYDRFEDLSYGELDRQKLDIYIPNSKANNILIIFFYGGSWDSGNKEQYKFVASSLTENGYTVAIPDYRLYPEVMFPMFMEDAAKAVAWLQNDSEYLNNIEHIYLMGHSAGAQIANLLISDERYLSNENVKVASLTGSIGIAGPYNFLPLKSDRLKSIFPEEIRDSSQPINFINGDEVPFLLLHGLSDKTVLPKNSETFAEKIKSVNGEVVLKFYKDVGHIGIIKPFINGFDGSVPTIKDINIFIGDTAK